MLNANDYIRLNNDLHGKLKRGERGYYPTPSFSKEEERNNSTTSSKSKRTAIDKAVDLLKKSGK